MDELCLSCSQTRFLLPRRSTIPLCPFTDDQLPCTLYWREGSWKDGETIALQGILVSSNHKEVHDSRYAIFKRFDLR